jgi:Phage gp6-like head-tail connector protein
MYFLPPACYSVNSNGSVVMTPRLGDRPMGLTLIQALTDEPVTLAEVKEHLRRTDTPEDDLYITGLITAAREMIEEQMPSTRNCGPWC